MTESYYQEFYGLTAINLGNIQKVQKTIAEAVLHIEPSTGGVHNLTLFKPRVSSEAPTSLTELFDGLNVEQVDLLKVFGESCQSGGPTSEIRWRIEIWHNDGDIDIIRCKEIHGLPRRVGRGKQ